MGNGYEAQIPLFEEVVPAPPTGIDNPSSPPEERHPEKPDSKRPVSDGAERHLGHEHSCLNKGFVRLVDYMGGDGRIVQAARVSYGAGTKTVREDKALIDYLLRNGHTSPFEQVVLTFHLKMPIFVARQWIRHRTARLNEISGRYSVMSDEFYMPFGHAIRYQSGQNKQGRSEEAVPTEFAVHTMEELKKGQDDMYAQYENLVEKNVARELARVNLPLSLYTEMYWQMDLHNLFHFLRLRMDGHAQYEIRVYADKIAEIVRDVAPMAFEAFEEHVLYGARLSRTEQEAITEALFADNPPNALRTSLKGKGLRGKRRQAVYAKLGIDPELVEDS